MPNIPSAPPLKLNLNVMRGGFREKLRELTAKLSGMAPSVEYRIRVPEELAFWYALEFGTHAYTIKPKDKKAMRFEGNGGEEVFASSVHFPGIRPRLIYRGIRDEWMAKVMELPFVEGLAVHGYEETEIAAMTEGAVGGAKELMAKRLEQAAPGSHEDGKLKGQTAASAWRDKAEVVKSQ
jgi:hypothetical protein